MQRFCSGNGYDQHRPFDFSDVSSTSEEAEATEEEDAEAGSEDELEAESSEAASESLTVSSMEAEAEVESSEETDSNAISLEESETSTEETEEAVSVASDEAESTLIYVDDTLYTGYYMDADGVLYSVKSGVATNACGYMSAGKEYYDASTSSVATIASDVVYMNGVLLTGYYYNTTWSRMYTC
ncbi:MAG: FtsK/SpoIIIE N-terminal domain-containing protein, partial [Clostridiales bacterium]|nr:FtsK/SpoIIIE N-terminal domain-containing protein [Clostridiales bacterium]